MLEELVGVDAIVDLNQHYLPAIVINKEIVFQHKKAPIDLEELTKLAQTYL